MRIFLIPLLLIYSFSLFSQQVNIIPRPQYLTWADPQDTTSRFSVDESFVISYNDSSLLFCASALQQYIQTITGIELPIALNKQDPYGNAKSSVNQSKTIYLVKENSSVKDQYELTTGSRFLLVGQSSAEVFYAVQSFRQLLFNTENKFPNIAIADYPRFEWRGMHLDVCRHFFPKDFIKKYIDVLAMHKMNVFHWHLTEDQGWRIEIKKYPKLTEIGGWRNGSMVGAYSDHNIDTIRYGGFYTQEDIKEIVAYANQRNVTIVPEIEMPGHALAALTAYPEYSCTGGPFEVAKEWGVFDDVYCAGSDETFEFIQDILDEVCELFPGKYIHIGGDECPKTRWEKCTKCQKRIGDNGLKDEHELQSYFIQRIEKYLNAKGKQIIGWDEILEGGLAPNAAVMSWRGIEGGTAAAKEKHLVVMSPGSHCYFDHYQGNPKNEPHAIGGYSTVEKVYAYEPVPGGLTEEESKYIIGAQGNVWTEYMTTANHVEYMALPRLCALSEVLWTNVSRKNEADFFTRLLPHMKLLAKNHYYFSSAVFSPRYNVFPAKKGIKVSLSGPLAKEKLKYTLNPTDGYIRGYITPTIYEDTISITSSAELRAGYYIDPSLEFLSNMVKSRVTEEKFRIHKATSCPVSYSADPDKPYNTDPGFTLVNGIHAGLPRINSQWLAWNGKDVEITIDLKRKEKIKSLVFHYLDDINNWIYGPDSCSISFSNDGKNFVPAELNEYELEQVQHYFTNHRTLMNGPAKKAERKTFYVMFNPKKVRYVKFHLKNFGKIPEGKPGAGNPSWLFLDEIEVY